MPAPIDAHWNKIKRVDWYLIGKPRMACVSAWQSMPDYIAEYTDRGWAGHRVTRKSVTGGFVKLGGHTIRSRSRDQSIVALSSGETELNAVNCGSQQGFGIRALMQDPGVQPR